MPITGEGASVNSFVSWKAAYEDAFGVGQQQQQQQSGLNGRRVNSRQPQREAYTAR
jgi:hypothetical protein